LGSEYDNNNHFYLPFAISFLYDGDDEVENGSHSDTFRGSKTITPSTTQTEKKCKKDFQHDRSDKKQLIMTEAQRN